MGTLQKEHGDTGRVYESTCKEMGLSDKQAKDNLTTYRREAAVLLDRQERGSITATELCDYVAPQARLSPLDSGYVAKVFRAFKVLDKNEASVRSSDIAEITTDEALYQKARILAGVPASFRPPAGLVQRMRMLT